MRSMPGGPSWQLQRIRDEIRELLSYRVGGHLHATLGDMADGVGAARRRFDGAEERGMRLFGTSAPDLGRPPPARTAGMPAGRNGEAAGLDDFGTFSDERRGRVPLAELRPQRVEMFDRAAVPLLDAEPAAMRQAHANISRLLDEAGGNPLSRYQVRVAMRNINATRSVNPANSMRSMRNCPEASLAVDDVLRGRPAVAGPLPGAPTPLARGVYQTRAIESFPRQSGLDGVEESIRDNAGSRGILIAHSGAGTNHIFNIADIDGRMTYLDGQFGTVLETRPDYVRRFAEFDFYRTA